jgi:hypothetical protein
MIQVHPIGAYLLEMYFFLIPSDNECLVVTINNL